MRDIVVAQIPSDRPQRVLDLGCGTGSLVFLLAEALPLASLVGLDVSAANVRAALARQSQHAAAGRLRFEAADYLEYQTEPFDAIAADGVLHLIPGATAALVAKIARDVRPGGRFVCSMPFDCAYNRAFAIVRRGLRAIRSPIVDAAILHAGRLLHGREMAEAGLRERVDYMYIPPERMMGPALAEQFAAAGLHRTLEVAMPSTSPSQLRHRVTIFARVTA